MRLLFPIYKPPFVFEVGTYRNHSHLNTPCDPPNYLVSRFHSSQSLSSIFNIHRQYHPLILLFSSLHHDLQYVSSGEQYNQQYLLPTLMLHIHHYRSSSRRHELRACRQTRLQRQRRLCVGWQIHAIHLHGLFHRLAKRGFIPDIYHSSNRKRNGARQLDEGHLRQHHRRLPETGCQSLIQQQ